MKIQKENIIIIFLIVCNIIAVSNLMEYKTERLFDLKCETNNVYIYNK